MQGAADVRQKRAGVARLEAIELSIDLQHRVLHEIVRVTDSARPTGQPAMRPLVQPPRVAAERLLHCRLVARPVAQDQRERRLRIDGRRWVIWLIGPAGRSDERRHRVPVV